MKYDCPKCQGNLKGLDLWVKEHVADEAQFRCPLCGVRLDTAFHAVEFLAPLFGIGVIVGLLAVAYGLFAEAGVMGVLVGVLLGGHELVKAGNWMHRNKQRYRTLEHAV